MCLENKLYYYNQLKKDTIINMNTIYIAQFMKYMYKSEFQNL